MPVIAIAIQKGGSGKTTTALNLAAAWRELGQNVLLVDLDPQCNLTQSMGLRENPRPSIFDILDAEASGDAPELASIIRQINGIPFIPASLELAKAELKLISVYGREKLLKALLEPLRNQYDHVILDCPPAIGMLTLNALVASDYVILPMQAEFLPLQGLFSFMELIVKDIIGKKLNPGLEILGILITRYDPRNLMTPRILERLHQDYEDKVLLTQIRPNIALAKAQEQGLDVFRYAPESNGALNYMALAFELNNRLKNLQKT